MNCEECLAKEINGKCVCKEWEKRYEGLEIINSFYTKSCLKDLLEVFETNFTNPKFFISN